ncbi:MAG: indole-3-glycerol phosphate synthase TrpC [Gemmatimonadaceae bacterium]
MQAFSRWTDPTGTLGAITAEAYERAKKLDVRSAELEREAGMSAMAPSLEAALRGTTVTLLAEVKRMSPSKGAIAAGLDAVAQARAYKEGGAAGVSILTEPRHFGGSTEDLRDVRAGVTIAILKKDFHVAPVQLLEARALGASAALLIARALAPDRLDEMMRAGRALGLELLVEVRDEGELERALGAGATMIGVNNRNLETLVIDGATAERIVPHIPAGVVAIAESGVRTREDVVRYASAGADAVLVGSSLSAAPDPVAATRSLAAVARDRRVR